MTHVLCDSKNGPELLFLIIIIFFHSNSPFKHFGALLFFDKGMTGLTKTYRLPDLKVRVGLMRRQLTRSDTADLK